MVKALNRYGVMLGNDSPKNTSTLHPPLGTPRCVLRLLPECVEVELSGSTSWIGCAGVGTESRIPHYSHRPVVTSPVVSPSRKIQSRVALSALGFSRSSWALADLTQSRTTVTPWPWVDY